VNVLCDESVATGPMLYATNRNKYFYTESVATQKMPTSIGGEMNMILSPIEPGVRKLNQRNSDLKVLHPVATPE